VAHGNRVALALGSGGARGYAHIGAIEVLHERGFEIVTIAGTSMGALVGGIAAAGKLEEYSEWSLGLTQREVWRLLDLTLSAPGAIRAERVLAKVSDVLGGALIEDLPIPFTAVATDLEARREVWFQRGPVDQAIRASIAIPGVITPVMFNGRLLVDGGLMNPVPIGPTSVCAADLTVAVSLTGDRLPGRRTSPVSESAEPRPLEEWAERWRRTKAGVLESEPLRALSHRISVARGREIEAEDTTTEAAAVVAAAAAAGHTRTDDTALPADIGVMTLLNMSFEAMSSLIARYRMASSPPDVLVTVPANAVRTLDFHKAAEMIALGRQLTTEALDRAGY
jgi:NTE family protein